MIVFNKRLSQRINDGKMVFDIGGYVLGILYSLVILIPLYYVGVSAFKDNQEIFSAPLALPARLGLENFGRQR